MWPPTLAALKVDMKIGVTDDRDDVQLQSALDASVAFVEERRPRVNYTEDPLSTYPEPTDDLILGTIRLAARWYRRSYASDGAAYMGELGTGQVPWVDPDIERMLRIGRFAKAVIG